MSEEKRENGSPDRKMKAGMWIGIGLALGAGIGVAMDNIALGVGIGLVTGAVIDLLQQRKAK
jgi:hypothetical protein